MKNYKKLRLLTMVLLGLLTFSCQDDMNETEQQEIVKETSQVDTSQLIDFKGLPVSHRFRTPIEELEIEHDYSALKTLYNKKRKSSALKRGIAFKGEEELPDAEIIVEVAEKRLAEFPYGENDASEKNLEMIQEDFPTLDGEQISENIDIIDYYYSQNLDYEVLIDVAEDDNIQAKITARKNTAKRDWGRFWCILRKFQSPWNLIVPVITGPLPIRTGEFSYIRTLISLYYANRAVSYSESSSFGNYAYGDTQRDAYRHILLSAFWAKYYYTVSSKVKRLRFSEAIGNANEDCGENPDDSLYMDYHNNRIGRKLFDDNCSYRTKKILWWRVTYGLNVPYESTLKSKTESLVRSGVFINKEGEGLSEPQTQQRIINTDRNKVVYFENK
jgi:hypothetical protein